MNALKANIVLFLFFMLMIYACKKKTDLPDTPSIAYKSFTQKKDSAYLVFSFLDGDGDIGLAQGDTNAPYNKKGNHFYNLFVTYSEKVNGQYKAIKLTPPLNYRIPNIMPEGVNKSLDGEIKIKWPAPYYNPLLNIGDTVKYDFYIEDRALNKSNVASTGDVIIQY